jgi:hypothetical protein
VELIGVHDQLFLARFRPVIAGRQGEPLADHIRGAETDARVACGEPADRLGDPFPGQQPVAEKPVPDVIRVVKHAGSVIQAVDPDVMKQAPGPHQVRVQAQAGPGQKLLSYPAHDQAMGIHKVERFRGRRVLLVQDTDLPVGRDMHGTAA